MTSPEAAISVALCTHNGAEFVGEQLLSILDQSLRPGEIVVSDDASTDETARIVTRTMHEWSTAHPEAAVRFSLLRNDRPLGVTANFEQALAACTGELVALSDQDDVWHPDRLARMAAEFDRRAPLLLLGSDARLVDNAGAPTGRNLFETLGVGAGELGPVHEGRAVGVLLRRNIVTGATSLLRRELVERARPFPASWVHDEWLAMVAALTGDLDLLPDRLVDYRQHGGNQIGASSLDTAGKIGRLLAPRAARNARLLARAEALRERAPLLTPTPPREFLDHVEAKAAHERARSALPAGRLRRIAPVFALWRAGNYGRYGLGAQDVLRDLVQPA